MAIVTDEQVLSIPGAFWQPDLDIFRVLLRSTQPMGGDLAELGVLFGRSAALIGQYVRAGETFTVIDLFETFASDSANRRENESSYRGVARATFEANYLAHHADLPKIVEGSSSAITNHATIGNHRFVHVDASHLFDHVAEDIENSRRLLKPDGILVLDDFRAEHTPGVAAAAWQAVVTSGLRPFAISPYKMYATWGNGEAWQSVLREWADLASCQTETQIVNGIRILRVIAPIVATPRLKPYIPPVAWSALGRLDRRRRLRHIAPRPNRL